MKVEELMDLYPDGQEFFVHLGEQHAFAFAGTKEQLVDSDVSYIGAAVVNSIENASGGYAYDYAVARHLPVVRAY